MPGDAEVRRYLARRREREKVQAERANPDKMTVTRRRAEYYILEAAYTSGDVFEPAHGPDFRTLLNNATDDVCVHLPFNPDRWPVMRGQTVGGLRNIGPPDFWQPSLPAKFRDHACEGYVLRQEGVIAKPDLDDWSLRADRGEDTSYDKMVPHQIIGLRSRLHETLSGFLTFDPDAPLQTVYRAHREELKLLEEKDMHEATAGLMRQVAKLHRLYEQAIFWFLPYSEMGYKETDEWLAQTRPQLGQERPLKYDSRCYVGSGQVVMYYREWPQLGMWQVTAFPQAVAWLKQWVQQALKDMSGG